MAGPVAHDWPAPYGSGPVSLEPAGPALPVPVANVRQPEHACPTRNKSRRRGELAFPGLSKRVPSRLRRRCSLRHAITPAEERLAVPEAKPRITRQSAASNSELHERRPAAIYRTKS